MVKMDYVYCLGNFSNHWLIWSTLGFYFILFFNEKYKQIIYVFLILNLLE